MGLSYSAAVFYGTFVSRGSALGAKLDRYIDKHGGTPAPVDGHPGIEVFRVGDWCSGVTWTVIAAKGSTKTYSREDAIKAPVMLAYATEHFAAVAAFLRTLGEHEFPSVGWYFGGSVS